jgi:hypothetical protein
VAKVPSKPESQRQTDKPANKPGISPSTLRRRLGEAERAMNKALAEQERLTTLLAAAGADHSTLTSLSEELGRTHEALALAETAWLELAAQAEAAGLSLD